MRSQCKTHAKGCENYGVQDVAFHVRCDCPAPPPRRVPDRPSDADRESMKFLAYRLRQMQPIGFCRDTITDAASWLERFAAAPPAEAPAERGDSAVLDVGFKYENGVHTPTVLVGFKPGDWDARDKFAANVAQLAAAPAAPAPDTAGEELTDYLGAALQLESLLLDQTSNYAERAIKHAAVALRIAHDKRSAVHSELPDDVMRALDRMCTPVEGSWLPRATAEADARSMKIIRDYILSAPRVTGGREVDERYEAEQHYTMHSFDYVRDPVGSKKWVDFWKGWQARAALQAATGGEGES